MLKKICLMSLICAATFTVTAQQKTEEICYNPNLVKDTTKKSIKSMAYAIVNGDSIKINYHSPGVRKRIIWGGLVPYEEVWVTGAHDATTLEIPKVFVVNGKEIPAGKYALFTIPGKSEWTIIINKQWKQHLATEYDEKDDVIRLKVKPKKSAHKERLEYSIDDKGNGKVSVSVAWEELNVSFDILLKS